MTAQIRLAQAISAVVRAKLDSGLGYLRIPEIVSPFPTNELLSDLVNLSDIRYAIFLDGEIPVADNITTAVYEAILWRNDPAIQDNLVVIGDLERDRAAGLASMPTITSNDVRQQVLSQLLAEARSHSAHAKTMKLLQALKSDRISLDLHNLADYAQALAPSFGTNDLIDSVSSLWRLRLLPDEPTADIDIRRLRENVMRVNELRQSDATTIQRLIGKLASQQSGGYEALRLFASRGEREHLRGLHLDAIREALRSARDDIDDSRNTESDNERATRNEQTQFLDDVRARTIDEQDFLAQFDGESDDDSLSTVSVNGTSLDWDRVPAAQLAPLLENDGRKVSYAESAGSFEVMPSDEPDPLPGKGVVSWESLLAAVEDLRSFERDVQIWEPPSGRLNHIIHLRTVLQRYVNDIPREGVRLFLAAPSVADTARMLVEEWVRFWQAMEKLRAQTTEVGELVQIAGKVALTDIRVVQQGIDITAYLLPLHPMILEPRVRAAAMFREHGDLGEDFFKIVLESIDPAVPSVKLPVEGTNYDLAYSGQFRSMPQYERRTQQFHSPDVTRALQEVIDRFVNVHPYARRSLRVALVDPTAETAKQLLKWLSNVDPTRRERVAVDVYVREENSEEIGAKLAEAEEELISAEIAQTRFSYSIERLARIEDLQQFIAQSDRSPHVLCLFDLAEVTQNATPIANLTPVLGALVNEWEFGARRAQSATPYIRPRTGSSALSDFLAAQARLLGTDSVGTTDRTPLLPDAVLETLARLGKDTSWVVVAQGASALVAPASIGELELLGRTSSGTHTAFVYSENPALVLEPVLSYLQQHAPLQANVADLIRFVLNTIRLALPEGLLGFYKRQGILSSESVLGRLGLAAVVANLQASADDPHDLIVSLDTEGARLWLGLREGVARRADLVRFSFNKDRYRVEAIEVKARSGAISWGSSPPDAVLEAVGQVNAVGDLLNQVFSMENDDQLAASRREILKRQVFLEALHQWESLRASNPDAYRDRISGLNQLFARGNGSSGVEVSKRIFLATPGDGNENDNGVRNRIYDGIPVIQLGLGWFRSLLASQPGGMIELNAELLDMLDLNEDTVIGTDLGDTEQSVEAAISAQDKFDIMFHDSSSGTHLEMNGSASAADENLSNIPMDSNVDPGTSQQAAEASDNLNELLRRLQESFSARRVPYISITAEDAVIGPSVIQFPVRLQIGARTSQVENQADDIARDLGVQAFRITNFPGRPGYALAEVPRSNRVIPDVTGLTRPELPYPALAMGAKLDFTPYWDCLDNIPHLLIAGRTGSGKSVLIRSLLWQLTHLYEPEELDLVLIGPKAADYLDFTASPHFKSGSDVHLRSEGAIDLLRDIVDVRYARQQAAFDEYARAAVHEGSRISNLRELLAHAADTGQEAPLRPFVVIIDEFVELLDASPSTRKEFEALIARFSRLFRYIGGTMIAATQRPSVKSITGDIKANFRPLALRVERSVDSRVILDEDGAEQLIGKGDSLYKADEGLVRLQGYSALGTYIN